MRISPPDLILRHQSFGYAHDSARLSQVLTILKEIAGKSEKALIFVEDLAMQETLAGLLQKHFALKTAPLRINGSVAGQKRQEIVDNFELNKNSFDVLILSPKAGGVGLTITSANHVIHLSRWWNPAVEDQATDRVFRIGQTRNVHVYLPMAVHPDPDIRSSSFDLRLDALIDRKRNLTRDLFLPPEPSEGELGELFREVSLSAQASSVDAGQSSSDVEASNPTIDAVGAGTAHGGPPSAEEVSARPLLTLPKSVVFSGIRRWKCNAGHARPTAEIMSLFSNKKIDLVAIRDPYALANSRSREAQVLFIKELKAACQSLEAVTVEYAPEVEGEPPDDGARRRAFSTEFLGAFRQAGPKLLMNRRARRAMNDDFHDRFVEVDIRAADGGVRRHEITIGRGLEALFNTRWQCTVTYAPPGSD